jgi:hypothetical protein
MRASLPADLLDDLEAEALRCGVTVPDLVDELVVAHLPRVLAEAAEEHLRTSLAVARRHERREPHQLPATRHHRFATDDAQRTGP